MPLARARDLPTFVLGADEVLGGDPDVLEDDPRPVAHDFAQGRLTVGVTYDTPSVFAPVK